MTTTDALLRRALERRDGHLRLTLDRAFQGLPDTAHGGSVLGAVDAAAGVGGPRRVAGVYRRRVPIGAPLALSLTSRGSAVAFEVRDETDVLLVDGSVTGAGDAARAADTTAPAPAPRGGHPLPVSLACFVCGTENAHGLRARLAFDDASVGGRWTPPATLGGAGGALPPVALAALLDEAAFWLGALATGEAGMTTDLRIMLWRPVPAGAAVVVAGARDAVAAVAGDPRYVTAAVSVRDEAGALVASADVTFAGVRGAARRLVTGMLAMNPPDVVRRVFPRYATA